MEVDGVFVGGDFLAGADGVADVGFHGTAQVEGGHGLAKVALGDGPDFLAFRRRQLQGLYGADAVGGVVFGAVHFFRDEMFHGGHTGAGGAVEGHPAFPVVVFVDADAAHMVHVHGQAAGFYVPEPTQQARYALNTLLLSTNITTI